MRAIKFRGFHSDPDGKSEALINGERVKGEWVYGGIVHQTDYYGDTVDRYYIIDGTTTEDDDIGSAVLVAPDTVGQFVNLGKNKREMYEGDIVDYANRYTNGRFVIKYSEDWPRFILVGHGNEVVSMFRHEKCKVIGNIYENPELVKGEGANETD